jgi:tetratricopeptide (TPR) repeat protein
MEYQEFLRLSNEAETCLEAGRLKDAETILFQLVMSDVSELDRAFLCTKMASVFDRQGNTGEALAWFDKGIAVEQCYSRFEIAEKKATYLAQLGRYQEAVKIYEELLKQPYLTEGDKERVRKIIQTLLGKTLMEWR